jgi:hypothetical protein
MHQSCTSESWITLHLYEPYSWVLKVWSELCRESWWKTRKLPSSCSCQIRINVQMSSINRIFLGNSKYYWMEGMVALRHIMEKDLLGASSIKRYNMNSLMAATLYLRIPNYLKNTTHLSLALYWRYNINCLEHTKLPLLSTGVCYLLICNNEKINSMELTTPESVT